MAIAIPIYPLNSLRATKTVTTPRIKAIAVETRPIIKKSQFHQIVFLRLILVLMKTEF